jgi:hypothetical protein
MFSGEKMKLQDEVIAHVAKLVQLAILSGTDVVDHMRMIELEAKEGILFLTEEYAKLSEDRIESMLSEIEGLQEG